MSNLVGWKLYYDDGGVFSSSDGDWKDAPLDGVLVLVEFYDGGERVLHIERDYYILDDDKAFGTNNLHPWLAKQKTVKYGRWSKNSIFRQILEKAKTEPL